MQYIIVLSDVEQRAMEYVAVDVNEWIQNVVHERARVAIEEIVTVHVSEKLAAGDSVSGTKEEIVMKTDLPDARARNDAILRKLSAEGMKPNG